MPVYVYKNLVTGETFELSQRITEDALTHHPETGEPVKRVVQPVGIAFKGSGFYVNDSRSGSKPSASSAGKAGGTESAGTPADSTKAPSAGSAPAAASAD